jgi:hypothetical protein
MACIDCARWSAAPGCWKTCSPACMACGGRYLWLIQRQQLDAEAKRERLRAALKVWVDLGHDEKQLRALAQRNWMKT